MLSLTHIAEREAAHRSLSHTRASTVACAQVHRSSRVSLALNHNLLLARTAASASAIVASIDNLYTVANNVPNRQARSAVILTTQSLDQLVQPCWEPHNQQQPIRHVLCPRRHLHGDVEVGGSGSVHRLHAQDIYVTGRQVGCVKNKQQQTSKQTSKQTVNQTDKTQRWAWKAFIVYLPLLF